ncbi:hypothetical protein [Vibrio harveyi]|uniref:hypothetical protein n=1 Tax=Vibrio harveyi TaxID=669 RepID=UPI0002C47B7E|nr:hypothetical protein [Vibrio harveyi]EMR36992.1 hypothetical protein MUQ_10432 [Vibrio harveyi CAIM 1792]
MKHQLMTVKQVIEHIEYNNIEFKKGKVFDQLNTEDVIKTILDNKYISSSVINNGVVVDGSLSALHTVFVKPQTHTKYCLDLQKLANKEYPICVRNTDSKNKVLLKEMIKGEAFTAISDFAKENFQNKDEMSLFLNEATRIINQLSYYQVHFVEQ